MSSCTCSVERHSCAVCMIGVEEVIHFCPQARPVGTLCAGCNIAYFDNALCDGCQADADAEFRAGIKPSLKKRIRHAAHNVKIKIRVVPGSPRLGEKDSTSSRPVTPTTPIANPNLLGMAYATASAGPSPIMGTTVAEAAGLLSPPGTPTAKRQSWIRGKLHRRSGSSGSGASPASSIFESMGSPVLRSAERRPSCDTITTLYVVVEDDGLGRPLPDFELPPRRDDSDSSLFETSDDSASIYSQ